MFCFFFFQAEDGIRDIGVTGVQTCALPICRAPPRSGARRTRLRSGGASRRCRAPRRARRRPGRGGRSSRPPGGARGIGRGGGRGRGEILGGGGFFKKKKKKRKMSEIDDRYR